MEQEQDQTDPTSFVEYVTQSANLAGDLSDDRLTEIGRTVLDEYEMDKESMAEWLKGMKRGLDLARLVKEDKTFPFDGAANVKYPLITSAALQFNARAYPAIVPADQVVKCQTFGADPQGQKAARGERVAAHMSYQLVNEVDEWEEDTDKLLVQLPIVGTMVRKWWYDSVQGRPACRLIEPGKFIINDKVKTLKAAPRASEEIDLYPTEIETRVRSGQFVSFEYQDDVEDKQAAQEFIEQHTRIDLDDDGYPEPYIVTVHKETQAVVRLVADFGPDDVDFQTETVSTEVIDPAGFVTAVPQEVATGILGIRRGSYFVAYEFVPSMDGGFWGTGLGALLGDISEAINTIINMQLDAGAFASLGGGFIGSEFRMKGGAQRFRPGEWKMTQSKGGDVRAGIVPMTFPGPDATLFQLLGLLIDAGREIASVKDIMTGDSGGKVQTATTTIALIEQGMMVFTAAYKRIFRSLKKEYGLLGGMNATTISPEEYNAFHDLVDQNGQPVMLDPAQEYGARDMDIRPVADPRSVTKMQEAAKAQLLREMAGEGMINPAESAKRILDAMEIGDVDELIPQPDPMQQQMAMMQMEAAMADLMQKRADIELTLARIEGEQAKAMKDMAGIEDDKVNTRLSALKIVLEDERGRLDAAISAATGRLAGTSGDGSPARSDGGSDRGAGGVNPPIILQGPGSAGTGAFGALAGGGMGY